MSKRKKRVGKKSWIRQEYNLSWKFIQESKSFIWAAFIIFALAMAFGFFFPIFYEQEILNFIKGLVSETDGLGVWQMIIYLFQNNLMSAFFGMIFGILFGFVPIMNAVINGYLVGFVAQMSVDSVGIGVLWRLVPHGIFELPALFLSLGLGLRLGFSLFSLKGRKKFFDYFSNALRVFIFIIFPLLLIAAIIEGSLIVLVG